ncbi:MAG: hypothetical protein V4617_20390 [Gemmatimonadota bacterium]
MCNTRSPISRQAFLAGSFLVAACVLTQPARLLAQAPPGGTTHSPGMQHKPGMEHNAPAAMPTQAGHAAFAAVSEIVRLLEADSSTNWATVNLEALRQHLVDMDVVTMRSRVVQRQVTGGLTMDITGDAHTSTAIRRMVGAHAGALEAMGVWRAATTLIPGGLRLTVVAAQSADARTAARIRGLGFIGLLTQGAHHAEHHLQIGKGASHAHGGH